MKTVGAGVLKEDRGGSGAAVTAGAGRNVAGNGVALKNGVGAGRRSSRSSSPKSSAGSSTTAGGSGRAAGGGGGGGGPSL